MAGLKEREKDRKEKDSQGASSTTLDTLLTQIKSTVEKKAETKLEDVAEELFPVVEREEDLAVLDAVSYGIHLDGYKSAEYAPPEGYYKMSKEEENVSASGSVVFEEYEHELLVEAQEVAKDMKAHAETGKVFADAYINISVMDIRLKMKTYSEMVWRCMYDGKLIFN